MNKINELKDFFKKVFCSKKLSFVGLKYAGKSQILETLGSPTIKAGGDSQEEVYDNFPVDFSGIGVNRKVFVDSGADLGGELEIFKERYAKCIRRGDFVFFVIDAKKFLDNNLDEFDNIDYRMAVLQRLDIINRNIPVKRIDKFHVILTHADELDDREQFKKEFVQTVNSEALKKVAKWIRHYYIIDATNQEEVLRVFERITR